METLSKKFPEIAKQWDYDKNGEITPDNASYGSKRNVWWKCDICGYSYQKRICNRTAPSKRITESDKCPICLGRIIIPEYNSLQAKYPKIVEQEWDYEKNPIKPDEISPFYRKKIWWHCKKGHSYQSLPGNKILNNGGNCPYCSSQRLCRETSLAFDNEDLAKQWHPTKNGLITPDNVFANSNKYAWWICPICGHEWSAKICNRNTNNRGCPNCAKGRSTSVPEQLIFYTIKEYFPDAINRFKFGKDEIDIFIPSINVGIEYDGQRFHNEKKLSYDIAKSQRIANAGISLYRFREDKCPLLNEPKCKTIITHYDSWRYADLRTKLEELIKNLIPCRTDIHVRFDKYMSTIQSDINIVPYEESFAASESHKAKQGKLPIALWDYEANHPLKPEVVKPFSDRLAHWICPTNTAHKWKNTIKSVSFGYGCPYCSSRHRYTTQEWIEKAEMVHKHKYSYDLVEYVNSETKVKIICPKHGVFEQIPYEHLNGAGCPYCAHQSFHPEESLAVLYPHIAEQWDYELNAPFGVTPQTIGIDTKRKFYWHCNNGCNHSYLATIAYRVKLKSGCAICHGKQVSIDTCLATSNPKLSKEWCSENDKTPYDVTPKSDYIALWKCENPNHPQYKQKVEIRTRGVGCKYCSSRKKHPKDFEDKFYNLFPSLVLLSPYTKSSEKVEIKCCCCGHIWEEYPHRLLKIGCSKCKQIQSKELNNASSE